MSFWEVLWFCFVSFMFIAYLMVMFSIIADIFRDPDTSGGMKALWIIALIFLPFVTAIIYLIARGKSMQERSVRQAADVKRQQDEYIREVAGSSPAEQIEKAHAMLDRGAITPGEFEQLKAKALA
ncbi:SHOCT domain-containing protein [Nocardioides sp.]|uniref:SHOCT domain-containing protein n=1 Tax=Nocardioides sp. TaxID=35761 RepID=UPI002D806666|nr:PLDc N-terminal domain-containing protein [Nocardioides sp.]HET8961415.1 PLDc N-terminal domain-containing protein [Nocardioides sp.]